VIADGAPLQPGREEAHRWAVEELAKRPYQAHRESLLLRGWRWLLDQIFGVDPGSGTGWTLATAFVVIVIAIVVVIAVRRVGVRGPRARARSAVVLDGVTQSAVDLRAAAAAAAARGDWQEAVIAAFRAVARDLEAAGTLTALPGRTADELAREAGSVLPEITDDLLRGARTFDAAAYGDPAERPSGEADYRRVCDLDDLAVRAPVAR
jgi:hypothetical protein